MTATCDITNKANSLTNFLSQGENFTFEPPNLDGDSFKLISPINVHEPLPLTNASLTTGNLDGTGALDVILKTLQGALWAEYKANRITGAEYTKAYIALMETALGNATQFVLQRDQASMQAAVLAAQLVEARLKIEEAKVRIAALSLEAKTNQILYLKAKEELALVEVQYCTETFKLENTLPKEATLLTSQIGSTNTDIALKLKQRDLVIEQIETERGNTSDTRTDGTTNSGLVGRDRLTKDKQIELISEQIEAERAKTLDTRTDGVTLVRGSIGSEKAVQAQQAISFKRNDELNAAELFGKAWITSKTADEGLEPPASFANPSLEVILNRIKINNGLDT